MNKTNPESDFVKLRDMFDNFMINFEKVDQKYGHLIKSFKKSSQT